MERERTKTLIKAFKFEDNTLQVIYGRGHRAIITNRVEELSGRGVEVGEGKYIPWNKFEPNHAFYPIEEPIIVSDSDHSKGSKKG